MTNADKIEALKCAYRAGAAQWGNRTAIDPRAEIRRARALLELPPIPFQIDPIDDKAHGAQPCGCDPGLRKNGVVIGYVCEQHR